MGRTTFSGPIRAGNIPDTTGTTVGTNVKNVGSVVMAQTVAVTQATTATALATTIVLPANSQIVGIDLFVTVIWSGVAATFNLGTTSTATELAVAADNTGAALTLLKVVPGASATRVAKWQDVGTSDVQLYVLSTNTGTGVGKLTVRYIQAQDLA